jgi:YVTN family beta-propeller protein
VGAIVSPAGVVFAVVWTAPPVANVGNNPVAAADTQPARMLPAPDVQPVSLPPPDFNVYANTLSGVVPCPLCNLPPRVYVPNSNANTVDVIDPLTFKVIDHFAVGSIPHHITPAWDMSALYVDNEGSSKLTVIDIHTGRPNGQTINIPYPYNLYFTPDGTKAIDVVERLQRIEFRDPNNGWRLLGSVGIPWPGPDHLDFSADGSYLMISTEYSGVVARVNVLTMRLDGYVRVGGLPIDVKLSPDGRYFFVTNQGTMGVSVIDPVAMKVIQFIPTGRGAHGLQISRDTKSLYVSNRLEGSFSVIDFATRTVVAKWYIPGGGSPDMLQLNPAGTQLWASGRYNATVYVMSTVTGQLLAKIPVGSQDHGLTYFPNVGLHSLGHNGVYR